MNQLTYALWFALGLLWAKFLGPQMRQIWIDELRGMIALALSKEKERRLVA